MASVIRGSDNFDSLIHQGLGVNQTWQNVTASREMGVTYTNTTGKPIAIGFRTGNGSVSNGVSVSIVGYVDESQVANQNNFSASYPYCSIFMIVPNNSTYKIIYSVSGATGAPLWFELR